MFRALENPPVMIFIGIRYLLFVHPCKLNIAFSIPHFGHSGAKFSVFQIFPFGLSGSSVSLPSFSFVPHLEVGYLFWKRKCTNSLSNFSFLLHVEVFIYIYIYTYTHTHTHTHTYIRVCPETHEENFK
jgi:hypothetical protein